MKKVIFALAMISFFWACKNEPQIAPEIEPVAGAKVLDLVPCDIDTSYFYNDVVPILVNSCAFSGCHITLSLASYNDIMNVGDVVPGDTANSYLYQVLVSTNPNVKMPRPPNNSLSDSQINVISAWIMQGAKPNACNDCDEQAFKFHEHIYPLIIKNCQGCHSSLNPSGGILLNNYFQIKQQAEKGTLLGSLQHVKGYIAMPPSGKMPACQIEVIENWINNGMRYD